MVKILEKTEKRIARHKRIRRKISGTSESLRMCVFRSLKNLSVQVIDDSAGKVIFGLSTLNKDVKAKIKNGGNIEAAVKLGEAFAAELQKKGIKKVVFDRGGYLYHGRVKAFAEAARNSGLEF